MNDKNSATPCATEATAPTSCAHNPGVGGAVAGGTKGGAGDFRHP